VYSRLLTLALSQTSDIDCSGALVASGEWTARMDHSLKPSRSTDDESVNRARELLDTMRIRREALSGALTYSRMEATPGMLLLPPTISPNYNKTSMTRRALSSHNPHDPESIRLQLQESLRERRARLHRLSQQPGQSPTQDGLQRVRCVVLTPTDDEQTSMPLQSCSSLSSQTALNTTSMDEVSRLARSGPSKIPKPSPSRVSALVEAFEKKNGSTPPRSNVPLQNNPSPVQVKKGTVRDLQKVVNIQAIKKNVHENAAAEEMDDPSKVLKKLSGNTPFTTPVKSTISRPSTPSTAIMTEGSFRMRPESRSESYAHTKGTAASSLASLSPRKLYSVDDPEQPQEEIILEAQIDTLRTIGSYDDHDFQGSLSRPLGLSPSKSLDEDFPSQLPHVPATPPRTIETSTPPRQHESPLSPGSHKSSEANTPNERPTYISRLWSQEAKPEIPELPHASPQLSANKTTMDLHVVQDHDRARQAQHAQASAKPAQGPTTKSRKRGSPFRRITSSSADDTSSVISDASSYSAATSDSNTSGWLSVGGDTLNNSLLQYDSDDDTACFSLLSAIFSLPNEPVLELQAWEREGEDDSLLLADNLSPYTKIKPFTDQEVMASASLQAKTQEQLPLLTMPQPIQRGDSETASTQPITMPSTPESHNMSQRSASTEAPSSPQEASSSSSPQAIMQAVTPPRHVDTTAATDVFTPPRLERASYLLVPEEIADQLCQEHGGLYSMALRSGMAHKKPIQLKVVPVKRSDAFLQLSADTNCGTQGSLYDICLKSGMKLDDDYEEGEALPPSAHGSRTDECASRGGLLDLAKRSCFPAVLSPHTRMPVHLVSKVPASESSLNDVSLMPSEDMTDSVCGATGGFLSLARNSGVHIGPTTVHTPIVTIEMLSVPTTDDDAEVVMKTTTIAVTVTAPTTTSIVVKTDASTTATIKEMTSEHTIVTASSTMTSTPGVRSSDTITTVDMPISVSTSRSARDMKISRPTTMSIPRPAMIKTVKSEPTPPPASVMSRSSPSLMAKPKSASKPRNASFTQRTVALARSATRTTKEPAPAIETSTSYGYFL
jgi:hypothetical protein